MEPRIDLRATANRGYKAVFALEQHVRDHVEHQLLDLIKLRASVVNGCAYCVDMHSTDGLAQGIDARRLFAVSAWRESPFFSPAERAALALTDAVTRLDEHGVPDDVWDDAVLHHGEEGTMELVYAIGTINLWNRIAVTTHAQPPALVAG